MPTPGGTYTNIFGNTQTTQDANGATNPYAPTRGPQSIATAGTPVGNLPNLCDSTNVSATILAVFQSGGRPSATDAPGGGTWTGAMLVSTPFAGQAYGQYQSGPTSNFNHTNGRTSTQQFLANVLQVDNDSQGTPVISNVTSITASFGGSVPASQVAVFRFQ